MTNKKTRISKGVKKEFVDLRFAKSKGYKEVLEVIKGTEKCPFCKENFKYHKKPILKTEKKWFITESRWPYKNTQYHFLIIPKEHKKDFNQLDFFDFKSVSKLTNWALKKYKAKGGGLTLRFGESSYTGSTVSHLHFHLIIPEFDKKTKQAKIVYFPIG